MSDEKTKVTDKASEIAKNIWLAGVGAYGKAVEDAQDRLEKAMEPPKLFRDLVKAGAALEDEARDAQETMSAARNSVEERINRVRENFHMQRPARIEDLLALHKKVDQLTRKVDKLSRALAALDLPEKKRPAATKKAPRQRMAAKKSSAATSAAKKSPKKVPVKRPASAKTSGGRSPAKKNKS